MTRYNLSDDIFITSQFDTSKIDTLCTKFDPPYDTDFCGDRSITEFSKLLYCLFIKLSFDELDISVQNDFLIVTKNAVVIKTLHKWKYRLSEGGVFICLEDYMPVYHAVPEAATVSDTNSTLEHTGPKRILSFICICLSLICLLITIVIYIKFSELRSQPGINNLILCICLLGAQADYQFGAGQPKLSHVACSIIGAICHLLWLAVMFSLNSCSFQMFFYIQESYQIDIS